MKPSFPRVLLYFLGVIFFTNTACEPYIPPGQAEKLKQDPLVNEVLEGIGDLSNEAKELSQPNRVEAWVDKLIIKSQPGQDMPQIGTMKQGEVAEYLYQRTMRKSTFSLRGQRYHEPWILIKTASGTMGWVHQGGVRFIRPDLNGLLTGLGDQLSTAPVSRSIGPAGTTTATSQEWMVIPGKYFGNIEVNTSENDLIQLFGASKVQRGKVTTSGKKTESCTIVFPGTYDEIAITWKDNSRSKVKAVYLLSSDSKWYLPRQISVGMSLSELTKANQGPLTFYGFGWEYSGTVNEWGKGQFAKYAKNFYVTLEPAQPSRVKNLLKSYKGNGDKTFSSNIEEVEQLGLVIERIVVYLD
ncbi:MAG: SH3 domain-containing protein [Bacteroidota bacterium]